MRRTSPPPWLGTAQRFRAAHLKTSPEERYRDGEGIQNDVTGEMIERTWIFSLEKEKSRRCSDSLVL